LEAANTEATAWRILSQGLVQGDGEVSCGCGYIPLVHFSGANTPIAVLPQPLRTPSFVFLSRTAMTQDPAILSDVKHFIRQHDFGVLSTTSVHLDGFPFGSVANYCLGCDGNLLMYFSTIAQHTKNIQADDRCSITILQHGGGNVQAEARVTVSGHLQMLEDDEAELERYHTYFPESREYAGFHDFSLYRLVPTAVRYIGGFGKIHWLEPDDIFDAVPFTPKEEQFIIDHMNDHHADSLRAYVRDKGALAEATAIRMIGIDAISVDLFCDGERVNVPTPAPMNDVEAVRAVLSAMGKPPVG
jgi:putative heme iron utilization protein